MVRNAVSAVGLPTRWCRPQGSMAFIVCVVTPGYQRSEIAASRLDPSDYG